MRTMVISGTILTVIGLVWIANAQAPTTEVVGPARVIDGDTIEIKGQRIRLWGIDAPERSQQCTDKMGYSYSCGRQATAVMQSLTKDHEVRCAVKDKDKYGRLVAMCEVDAVWDRTSMGIVASSITMDLGEVMVLYGWAVDYTHYSKGYYAADQASAIENRRGMHQGTFQQPADYRHTGK